MESGKLIIIGSGPAGLTAAIYAARANLNPVVISGMLPGGLLTQTSEIENFPGFPEAINGFELVSRMQQQAERFGAVVEFESVTSLELSDGGVQKVTLSDGRTLESRALIFATGASPRWLGVPGDEEFRNRGVSACATCDGAFYRDVPVAVVGGGDSAMEEANFLTHFASKVYVIHRRNELRASKIMAERALANPKIEFVWNSVVEKINGEDAVSSLTIRNLDGSVKELEVKACFAALGHIPSTSLVAGQLELDEHGFVKVAGGTSLTNLRGVFAAGACADPRYRQAITAAASGCRAAMDAEKYLAE